MEQLPAFTAIGMTWDQFHSDGLAAEGRWSFIVNTLVIELRSLQLCHTFREINLGLTSVILGEPIISPVSKDTSGKGAPPVHCVSCISHRSYVSPQTFVGAPIYPQVANLRPTQPRFGGTWVERDPERTIVVSIYAIIRL